VVASTQGLQVRAYKANSKHVATNLIASLLVDVSKSSKDCKSKAGGARTCTARLPLNVGAADFVMTTWDKKPKKTAPAGNELAAGSALDDKLKTGKVNRLKLTLGGIPASLALALPSPTPGAAIPTVYIHGTTSSTLTVGIEAFDADGNEILSDDFARVAGGKASVALGITPSASTCGSAQFSPASLPSPAPGGVTFTYGGTATAQLFTAQSPCTFALTASIGTLHSPAAQVALLGPELETYPVSGLGGAPSSPDGIVTGPDGNVWFADTTAGAIGRVNVQASPLGAITEYAANESGKAANAPLGITVGPDNNLWFTASALVGQMSPIAPASVSTYAVPTPAGFTGSTALGEQITPGPADVLVWFTFPAADLVYSVNVEGGALTPHTPASPLPAGPTGIDEQKVGNSYLLWFASITGNTVQAITPSGVQTHTFPISGAPSSTASSPQFLIVNDDQSIWYTSSAQHAIVSMTPFGFATPYVVNGSAQPWGLTFGPDEAVWFTDLASGTIDRIPIGDPGVSQISQYALGSNTKPKWITVGPDGALWFTESGTGAIGRISY
jgi:virginiamycin B lyase